MVKDIAQGKGERGGRRLEEYHGKKINKQNTQTRETGLVSSRYTI